jgi:hypothetical protein
MQVFLFIFYRILFGILELNTYLCYNQLITRKYGKGIFIKTKCFD